MMTYYMDWRLKISMTKESKLLKCSECGAEMIEMTNDHVLECLNCGAPYQKPVDISHEK